LFSFIKICIDSYISFERFVQWRFSKLLSTNILLFKRCKYVSPQKLTFLVQNMTLQKWLQWISNIKILKNTINKHPYFELIAKRILSKLLNFNLKSNLEGIFNFWFQKILINIGECNSRSKSMDMIYMSLCTTLFSKSSQNYASKLHFITLFDNSKNLDYPQTFKGHP
jgi:hypothetical protein